MSTSKSKTATKPADELINKKWPIDIIKHRWVFLWISVLFLLPGLAAIAMNMANPEIRAPLLLGIDFKGGTMLEYGFEKKLTQADLNTIREVLDKNGYTGSVVQLQEERTTGKGSKESAKPEDDGASETGNAAGLPMPTAEQTKAAEEARKQQPDMPLEAVTNEEALNLDATHHANIASIVSIRTKHMQPQDDVKIKNELSAQYGNLTILQKNSIGPSLASELLTNGLFALLMAYVLIVGYLTFRFQFDFAICAMLALAHDTLFVLGMFAIFGHLFHTEVDSLFITAILTAVGFSVHDTIVVFDRIRENHRLYFTKKVPFNVIANMSVNQTLVRSLNTSFTAMLTMLAMYFFGGETTRDFVLAILLGIAVGTYSSIFNASVLLAMWREKQLAKGVMGSV